jgi:hypothetical protein
MRVGRESLGKHVSLDCRKVGGIDVIHATYGENCRFTLAPPFFHKIRLDNATDIIKKLCQGKTTCSFDLKQAKKTDPAQGCNKNLKISYYCAFGSKLFDMKINGDVLSKPVLFHC